MTDQYPEHEKLAKIAEQSQACGEFLEWLDDKGIVLATYREGHHYPDRMSYTVPNLLAEFFEIDQNKLEAEKRAMLDALRASTSIANNPAEAEKWGDDVGEHWVIRDDARAEHAAGTFGNADALMAELDSLIAIRREKGSGPVRVYAHLPVELTGSARVISLRDTGAPVDVIVITDALGVPA